MVPRTHRRIQPWIAGLIGWSVCAALDAAHATTFVVTSTADTAGTTCGATCTLRQAITAANAAAGADTINFNIPGGGVHSIAVTTKLPDITSPVTIDGYSQPGSVVNSAGVGSNAVLTIELSGANFVPPKQAGLYFAANSSPSTVRGLVINGFDDTLVGWGIVFLNLTNVGGAVKGCFIGTNAAGTAAVPNGQGAIVALTQYSGLTIGGTALADRNLIAGNRTLGMELDSPNNTVQGNLIGVAADGVSLLGNGADGVILNQNSLLGGITAAAGNVIAGNLGRGVSVGFSGNTIEHNSIYANKGIGIDLALGAGGSAVGPTPNDAGDGDTGSNNLQNYPVLTAVGVSGTTLTVVGSLNSKPSRTYRIEYFANLSVDPSGFGEGQFFIGSNNVNTNAGGDATIFVSGPVPGIASRQYLTATATDTTTGDTSEFSAAVVVATNTTVVNTNDSGPGSLRQAILNANANVGADFIDFAIPGGGRHVIQPLTPLPDIYFPVTIDGYTQLGSVPNSLGEASNAVLTVQIDGANLVGAVSDLAICAPNSIVRGLALTGAPLYGVAFARGGENCIAHSADGSQLAGSFVGVDPDGTAHANQIGTIAFQSAVQIGGTSPSDRNVISANSLDGVEVVSGNVAGTVVEGNLVGWGPDGTTARGNTRYGVLTSSNTAGSTIGTAATPNRIGNNGTGVAVAADAATNTVFANSITANFGLGIELCAPAPALCPDGVTPNDLNDGDPGANTLQNFPIANAITRTTGGLHINATLDRPSGAAALTFTIGVYSNTSCDASGNGEGERFLGTLTFPSASGAAETIDLDFVPNSPVPVGSLITLTATDPNGNTSEFSPCAALDAAAQNFVVNSAADTDDGACTAAPGGCTLREALNAANAHAGGDTISFNVPGGGVHKITFSSLTPQITDTVTIDGYTQPGAAANTLAEGDNAKILIQLDGSALANSGAFSTCASNITIRGLSIGNFPRRALQVGGVAIGCRSVGTTIAGNWIGLAPDGLASTPNSEEDIGIYNSADTQIGGADPSARNLIAGKQLAAAIDGIKIGSSAAAPRIDGNYIGTDASGTLDRGNSGFGIALLGPDDAKVGEAAPNLIAFNLAGIVVTDTGNRIARNRFRNNTALGIDLCASSIPCPDGVSLNDVNDPDTGGNNRQNFPLLGQTEVIKGELNIAGTLDVPVATSNATYQIAIYQSEACGPSGHGQGENYLGSGSVVLSGNAETFQFVLPVNLPPGGVITATATDPNGNTSEFSACSTLVAPPNGIFSSSFESGG